VGTESPPFPPSQPDHGFFSLLPDGATKHLRILDPEVKSRQDPSPYENADVSSTIKTNASNMVPPVQQEWLTNENLERLTKLDYYIDV